MISHLISSLASRVSAQDTSTSYPPTGEGEYPTGDNSRGAPTSEPNSSADSEEVPESSCSPRFRFAIADKADTDVLRPWLPERREAEDEDGSGEPVACRDEDSSPLSDPFRPLLDLFGGRDSHSAVEERSPSPFGPEREGDFIPAAKAGDSCGLLLSESVNRFRGEWIASLRGGGRGDRGIGLRGGDNAVGNVTPPAEEASIDGGLGVQSGSNRALSGLEPISSDPPPPRQPTGPASSSVLRSGSRGGRPNTRPSRLLASLIRRPLGLAMKSSVRPRAAAAAAAATASSCCEAKDANVDAVGGSDGPLRPDVELSGSVLSRRPPSVDSGDASRGAGGGGGELDEEADAEARFGLLTLAFRRRILYLDGVLTGGVGDVVDDDASPAPSSDRRGRSLSGVLPSARDCDLVFSFSLSDLNSDTIPLFGSPGHSRPGGGGVGGAAAVAVCYLCSATGMTQYGTHTDTRLGRGPGLG